MKAMILAAGRGERLRPLTATIPKCLVEVRGQSLLERHLRHVRDAGIESVVVNLGWLGDKIEARIGSGDAFGLDVRYSREGDDILETGGGIVKALPLLGDEPFVVINADVFTEMPVPVVELGPDMLGHLVLVPTPDYRPSGDFHLVDGLIRNSDEPTLTFSGVAVYRPEFFAHCEPVRFPLAPMLREAADSGRLSGSLYKGLWADVGTPDRLAALNRP